MCMVTKVQLMQILDECDGVKMKGDGVYYAANRKEMNVKMTQKM